MEYRQLIFKQELINELNCPICDHEEHQVVAEVKYAFLFLEYLPFFPTKKIITVSCNSCENIYSNKAIESSMLASMKKRLFPRLKILLMFTGLFMTLIALLFWQYNVYQNHLLAKRYISAPKANDFYYIDYSQLAENSRPNEKYLLGKVVNVNEEAVLLAFGNFLFTTKSSLENDLRGGMVVDDRYFNRKSHLFSIAQLNDMYKDNTIFTVKRPMNNRLFGNVVTTRGVIANEKSRGSKENERGLAFLQDRKSKENLAQAKKYFLKSANLGYTPGQLNLAKLNLTSGRVEEALYWFKQAALQGNELAIEFYWDTCKKLISCEVDTFTNELTAQGFIVEQP